MNPISYKQETGQGTPQKVFTPGRAPQSPAEFQSLI